jgi:hypothetical protein
MQEQRDLVEQTLGRARALDDDRAGEAPQLLLFIASQRAARVNDHGRKGVLLLLGHLLQQLQPGAVGQRQVEHHAVEGGRAQLLQRLGGAAHGHGLNIVAGQQPASAVAVHIVILHDQHAPQLLREFPLQPLQRFHQLLALHRLDPVARGAHLQRGLRVVRHRHHVHRDVACRRPMLERVQHG